MGVPDSGFAFHHFRGGDHVWRSPPSRAAPHLLRSRAKLLGIPVHKIPPHHSPIITFESRRREAGVEFQRESLHSRVDANLLRGKSRGLNLALWFETSRV
jgi:hypothetical protein